MALAKGGIDLKKKRALYGFLTIFLMALFAFAPELVFFNVTPSIPCGIYLRVPATTLRNGDVVVYEPPEEIKRFCLDNGWMPYEQMHFIKKVAISGSHYQVGTRFIIDGKDIGSVESVSPSGVKLPSHHGNFIVPDDNFLPYGTDTKSFDGRYEGTIPESRIIARVVPIWIF